MGGGARKEEALKGGGARDSPVVCGRTSGGGLRRSAAAALCALLLSGGSHDAVGEVLEAVVQLGGQRPHGSVHQLVHQQLQLLLRQGHVEALLQATHGAAAVEAGQLGAWWAEEGGSRWGRG